MTARPGVTLTPPAQFAAALDSDAELRPGRAHARRSEFLPFAPPCIGDEEVDEVVATLRSGWITTGPRTHRFEREFARYTGAPGALGLSSCTAGLHTALITLGVGAGDEVITSTLTFTSTANVVEHVGAGLVLVDVEPDTLNISPAAIEAAITPRTRAIIAVHLGGHPADLTAIQQLAAAHGIAVIEDAAHGIGASFEGRRIGSGGNPAAFSFYATKNLTTGEGGMLTGDRGFLERARVISLHGMSRDAWERYGQNGTWFYDVVLPGLKYNMTDIQAALGLVQLAKMDAFQRRRREIATAYSAAFASMDALEVPVERANVEHAWHLFCLRLRPGTLTIGRDDFVRELGALNIGTSVHFIPVHTHQYYRDKYSWGAGDFPVTWDAYQRMFSLPIHPGMSESDIGDVVGAVLEVSTRFLR